MTRLRGLKVINMDTLIDCENSLITHIYHVTKFSVTLMYVSQLTQTRKKIEFHHNGFFLSILT
jgi:hypothetical protein